MKWDNHALTGYGMVKDVMTSFDAV